MKNLNLNKLEKLNNKYLNNHFIKSYPILNELPLSPAKIKLLELIYSYQSNGQQFNMSYANISNILKIKVSTIGTYISNLKEAGYITTTTIYNAQHRGSLTIINLNIDSIISEIEDIINQYDDQLTTTTNNQPAPQNEKVEPNETPTKPAVKKEQPTLQPAPKNEAVKNNITVEQPKQTPQLTFEELFPEDEDNDEHVTIKSIDRDKIKEAEELEKAEEMEAKKFAEDTLTEMNNLNKDEQCILNIITNEDDQQLYFELDQLEDIIDLYNDQLTTNLKDTTIFINVVNQLINKDQMA